MRYKRGGIKTKLVHVMFMTVSDLLHILIINIHIRKARSRKVIENRNGSAFIPPHSTVAQTEAPFSNASNG